MTQRFRLAIGAAAGLAWLVCFAGASRQNGETAQLGDWKRRAVAETKLTAELPAEAQKLSTDNRAANQRQIEAISAARLQVGGVILRFSHTSYSDGAEVDLDQAAQGALSSLKGTTGLTELKFQRSELKVSEVPAIRLECTYQYQGSPVSYWIVIAGRDEDLWQASGMFRTVDDTQKTLVQRVLSSLKIEK